MAFCDLKPVRIYSESTGITYYVGDVFAVYSNTPTPLIYSWDQVTAVTEDKRAVTIRTKNFDYIILKKEIASTEDYFRALAIIECAQRSGGFEYDHQRRILPLKSEYIETDPGKDCYSGSCIIDEGEAASTFVMLMNFRLMKVLWLLAVILMLVIFLGLHLIFGVTRSNVLYFIPISMISGAILTLLVYIICHAAARRKYTSVAGCDPASDEEITFLISPLGFAACESCTYDGQELIPWSSLDYFVESDKMFVFYKDGSTSVFIPKRAFDKKCIGGIADIISLRLEQR
ncbi:MAG: YcxB family protein [Oscillospiraceae bacterium]|nr:YcxB family protein [Oscillospiraceae bacterium]